MIYFFRTQSKIIIAVDSLQQLDKEELDKLNWLFSNALLIQK